MKHFFCFTIVFLLMLFSHSICVAQIHQSDFHAGIHSGSWTLQREQILDQESKDPHRSCTDSECQRCSKHLADYGHEYQYIAGPSQHQLWYPGTKGTIAPVTQRGYDEHGCPYSHRGQPGAVMSWEYQRVLNHAISEQICARNAVAAEETAQDRVAILAELWEIAKGRFLESEILLKNDEYKCGCGPDFCAIRNRFEKDRDYFGRVDSEYRRALQDLERKTNISDNAVRIALLSKSDADRATRFKRIQQKPPRYQEVLAASESAESERTAKPETQNK
ncbi:MAG: hypothetical protein ACRCUY_01555 [Thermoguttaceae bacterium]